MKVKRYRIVRDGYAGYEAQVWRLWFPFWVQCFFVNTEYSIDRAKEVIEDHKNKGKTVYKD